MGRVTTADDACRAVAEAQLLHERKCETRGFIGNDPPGKTASIELIEQFRHTRKQACLAAQVLGVKIEEFPAHFVIPGIARFDAEPETKQPARARRGFGADKLDRQSCETAGDTLTVESIAKIESGIGKRSVEIEKNSLGHLRELLVRRANSINIILAEAVFNGVQGMPFIVGWTGFRFKPGMTKPQYFLAR
jgi:hypothetical protein